MTTLWVFDVNIGKNGINNTLNIYLKPGEKLSLRGSKAIKIEISGSDSSHIFNSWFITSRGNAIPLRGNIIVAQVSEGIGSIAIDIKNSSITLFQVIKMEQTSELHITVSL